MAEGSLLNLVTFGYTGRYEAAATRAEGASRALQALGLKTQSQDSAIRNDSRQCVADGQKPLHPVLRDRK
ncbi:hypothetical protein MYXA107069_35670 [Myxococcus xanthus]|nr:hypothetical protein MyxoNM_09495 [Myxococcus xanthus]SDY25784.1 hypothetical protein SAMN05444383_12820 [Myxococcus xanthus]